MQSALFDISVKDLFLSVMLPKNTFIYVFFCVDYYQQAYRVFQIQSKGVCDSK